MYMLEGKLHLVCCFRTSDEIASPSHEEPSNEGLSGVNDAPKKVSTMIRMCGFTECMAYIKYDICVTPMPIYRGSCGAALR